MYFVPPAFQVSKHICLVQYGVGLGSRYCKVKVKVNL